MQCYANSFEKVQLGVDAKAEKQKNSNFRRKMVKLVFGVLKFFCSKK